MNCPVCNSSHSKIAYANKTDWATDIVISVCSDCGFIFQSSAYSEGYDDVIPTLRENYCRKNENYDFPRRTSDSLDTLQMIMCNLPHEKDLNILEIGSNRGDLLYMIKEKIPEVNILGVEPTRFDNLRVPTINSLFRKDLFANKFDIVIMQHTLEHIKYPKSVICDIKDVLTDAGMLFIEVPNVDNSLKYCTEDFILEHVNYFNLPSLERTMEGFEIIQHREVPFLRTIAKKSKKKKTLPDEAVEIDGILDAFIQLQTNKEKLIQGIIRDAREGKHIVFYGAGNYFKILFKGLQSVSQIDNCYYYDDNYSGDFEYFFGLPRLKKFDNNCVVIICSNVYNVQEKIEKKLYNHKGLTIVKPWSDTVISERN